MMAPIMNIGALYKYNDNNGVLRHWVCCSVLTNTSGYNYVGFSGEATDNPVDKFMIGNRIIIHTTSLKNFSELNKPVKLKPLTDKSIDLMFRQVWISSYWGFVKKSLDEPNGIMLHTGFIYAYGDEPGKAKCHVIYTQIPDNDKIKGYMIVDLSNKTKYYTAGTYNIKTIESNLASGKSWVSGVCEPEFFYKLSTYRNTNTSFISDANYVADIESLYGKPVDFIETFKFVVPQE